MGTDPADVDHGVVFQAGSFFQKGRNDGPLEQRGLTLPIGEGAALERNLLIRRDDTIQ